MAAVLHSSQGRQLLSKKTEFETPQLLNDWLLLVETMLEWERWLVSDRMELHHVQAAQEKHQYIMYLIQKVGKRSKGMGLKIVKFHAVLHMVEEILEFGVPMEYDTGSNESGHKITKKAALLTQRNASTFDKQTVEQLVEIHLLALAMEEIMGQPLWDYWQGHKNSWPDTQDDMDCHSNTLSSTTGGAKIACFRDRNGNPAFKPLNRFQDNDKMKLESDLVEFVIQLQDAVADWYPEGVQLRTEHHRGGHFFCAHAMFRGQVW